MRSKLNKFEHVCGPKPCTEGLGTCSEESGPWLGPVHGPSLNKMTDTTESITFLKLRWRAVNTFASVKILMSYVKEKSPLCVKNVVVKRKETLLIVIQRTLLVYWMLS